MQTVDHLISDGCRYVHIQVCCIVYACVSYILIPLI